MPAKKPRSSKHVRVDESPYDYDVPGALTPEQRDACLDGLVGVLLDIYLDLTPEQKARYMQ
jgi:hypothetical protein